MKHKLSDALVKTIVKAASSSSDVKENSKTILN